MGLLCECVRPGDCGICLRIPEVDIHNNASKQTDLNSALFCVQLYVASHRQELGCECSWNYREHVRGVLSTALLGAQDVPVNMC